MCPVSRGDHHAGELFDSRKNSDGEAIVMGNATPAESPRSGSEDYRVEGIASATDTSVAGDVLAVRTPDGLLVGTQETMLQAKHHRFLYPASAGT